MNIINSTNRDSWLTRAVKSDVSQGDVLVLPREVFEIDDHALDKLDVSKIVIPEESKLTFISGLRNAIRNIKEIQIGRITYKVVRDYYSFYSNSYFLVNTKEKGKRSKAFPDTVFYNGCEISFSFGKLNGKTVNIAQDKKQDKWMYANDLDSLKFKVNYAQPDNNTYEALERYLSQNKVDDKEAYNIVRYAIDPGRVIGYTKDAEDTLYERFKGVVGDRKELNAQEVLCILQGKYGLRDGFEKEQCNDCINCHIVAQQKVCEARNHCLSFGKFK